MAISKNGLLGNTKGKIGNLVYYESHGKNVVRRKGNNLHPASDVQKTSRMQIAVTNKVIKACLEYVNVGFGSEALLQHRIPYNMAMSFNKMNAVTGTFPGVEINYEKLLLSQGNLTPAVDPVASLESGGLRYDWFSELEMSWPELNDQAMLIAYFPVLEKASFLLYGPSRISGTAVLPLDQPMLGEYMETYISFISADRKQASDSTYTGSFNKR